MKITISLSDTMYAALTKVSASAHEQMVTPETWATEAVESAIASRVLPSVETGRYGGRPGTAVERDYEQEPYRVRLDAMRDSQVLD